MHLTNTFATAMTAVLLLAAAGCETVKTTNAGAVGVNRKQQMLVDSKTIDAGAAQAYETELKTARDKGALNTDKAQLERVTRVAKRIVAVAPTFRPDAASWNWQFNVQKTDELNAYCMPGGRIMVYSGLIDKLDLSDAELATVLGHEIAHALREHSREQASQQMAEQIGLGVLGAGLGLSDVTQQLSGMLLKVGFELPHSRTDETEADRVGLELAARSGYDPHAAVTLWQKMGQVAGGGGGGGVEKFLSDHPPTDQRLADMKANADKLQPIYVAAKK